MPLPGEPARAATAPRPRRRDTFEAGNLNAAGLQRRDLGTNKAEALARVARETGVACQAIGEHVDEANVRDRPRGDVVLLAVDNHRTRALVDRHLASLDNATLISGGNDETDGNVQLVRRRDGWPVDGHLDRDPPGDRRGATDRRSNRSPAARFWRPSDRSSS